VKKLLVIFLISFVLLIGGVNSVQGTPCNSCDGTPCDTGESCIEGVCQNPDQVVFCSPLVHKTFGELIDAIVNFIFTIALVLAPLMAIVGAFYIMSAGGDPKKVGAGKSIIIYTLIGFAIILFAKGLISMIESVIGVKIGG